MRVKRSCKIERFFVTHWPPMGYTSSATAMTPYTVKVSPNPHKLTVRPPPCFGERGDTLRVKEDMQVLYSPRHSVKPDAPAYCLSGFDYQQFKKGPQRG